MGQIAQDLIRIQGAKSALRDAILAKGGTLSEAARIDEYAPALRSIPSSEIAPIKLKDGNNFSGWSKMTALPPIDTSEASNLQNLASYCTSLEQVVLTLPTATDLSWAFMYCSSLRFVQITAPQLVYSGYAFKGDTSLIEAIIDYPSAVGIGEMCNACSRLETIRLNIPRATDLTYTFADCIALRDVYITGLKTSLSLQWSPKLSLESVQYIVEHAQEAMDGAVLTLPRALESKLPEETMEMALEKGFDVGFR